MMRERRGSNSEELQSQDSKRANHWLWDCPSLSAESAGPLTLHPQPIPISQMWLMVCIVGITWMFPPRSYIPPLKPLLRRSHRLHPGSPIISSL